MRACVRVAVLKPERQILFLVRVNGMDRAVVKRRILRASTIAFAMRTKKIPTADQNFIEHIVAILAAILVAIETIIINVFPKFERLLAINIYCNTKRLLFCCLKKGNAVRIITVRWFTSKLPRYVRQHRPLCRPDGLAPCGLTNNPESRPLQVARHSYVKSDPIRPMKIPPRVPAYALQDVFDDKTMLQKWIYKAP